MIPEWPSQNLAAISATKRNFNLIRANSTKRAYLRSCSWSGVVDRDSGRRTRAETGGPTPARTHVGTHDRGRPVRPDARGLRTRPDRAGGGRTRSYQIDTGSPAGPRAAPIRVGARLSIQAERSRRHLDRCRRCRGEELPNRRPHGGRFESLVRGRRLRRRPIDFVDQVTRLPRRVFAAEDGRRTFRRAAIIPPDIP